MRAFDARVSLSGQSIFTVALVLAAMVALCSAAQAKPKFVTFMIDGADTLPTSINAKGAITGYWYLGGAHGFVRQPDGSVETFDVPGAAGENGSMPSSINTKGEVAGLYYSLNKNGKYVPHGFLRKPDGTIKTFRIHSDSGGDFPSIVNSAGAIIGAYFHGRTPHGFIRDSHGTITTFDCPCGPTYVSAGNDFNAATGPGGGGGFVRNPDGTFTLFNAGQFTAPLAINDQGSVTGTIGDADAWEGFLRTPDGTITLFVVSDAANGTRPDSINADGVITGRFGDETGAAHGFIRAIDGTIVTFDPEGSASTYPASINDKGAIAGSYYDGVHYVGFVRTP